MPPTPSRALRSCSNATVQVGRTCLISIIFFFFQAEDGIRDRNVTGVQTCALPIYRDQAEQVDAQALQPHQTSRTIFPNCPDSSSRRWADAASASGNVRSITGLIWRSEERRVGKECRLRWSEDA